MSIGDKPHQVIVQGVHELYDLEETNVRWKDEERMNRMVLIGKGEHAFHMSVVNG